MTKQRVLVTGASGFIGRSVCAELLKRGYEVRSAVRVVGVEDILGEVVGIGEIGSYTDWANTLVDVDSVIHLAARVHVMRETAVDPLAAFREVNVAGTERLARAAVTQGVRRIVYTSSIGVNGNNTSDDPFSVKSPPAPNTPYTISKFEAEQLLLKISVETGLEVVIIRPPLVYGPGNPGNFMRLLKLVWRGIPLPLASAKKRRSMIYVGNLSDVLIACATCPEAAGKTYLVSDCDDVSTAQLIRNLSRLMGKPCRLWSFPPVLLRLAGRLLGKSGEVERLLGSLVIDSTKFRQELGWTPPFTIEQGLAETVQWYKNSAY